MAEKRSALHATDKLAFLLSLVPYLIDRGRVSVAEAAEHFGVSVGEIRRAVELIAVSGVPGETNQYQHDDLFDIAWDDFEQNDVIVLTHMVAIDESPRFSAREAAALIAGLQYLSSLPENADRAAIATLMSKLARGASSAPSQVAVDQRETSDVLSLVELAVAQGRQLEFDYAGVRDVVERRRVDPLRVESVDADWYLRGYDHLRHALRTFRLDRIARPALTDEPLAHRASDVVLPDTLFEGSPDDETVTIDIDSAAAPLLADYAPDDVEPLDDGRSRLRVRVGQFGTVARLVAGLPGDPEVVSPIAARAAVGDWASLALAGYDADPRS
ncbi:YafY family protein [Frigoribacterium sp. CFBP 13712]|uniref:helix-turn-helix transcriptional regulator n=1 Tax=Frigoribacterium sp. CFBP 13712 TaxID=2775309 RepID=UPI00177BCC8A|nr:WYL domain-containing protein [Frigoribacterium sp. CFBP 13712]MBD8703548.1 WYL domain-containing protein [Frigoribacterium sp. CFBP 13712]